MVEGLGYFIDSEPRASFQVTRADVFAAWQRFVGTAIASGLPLDPTLLPVLIADALALLEPVHEDADSPRAVATDLTVAYAEELFRDLLPEDDGAPYRPELAILRERYDAAVEAQARAQRLYARALRASECAEDERTAQECAETAAMLRGPFHAAVVAKDVARAAYLGAGGVL